jgi:hypothetical protein
VSAYSAGAPGETVVEPHDESSDGRGGDEFDAAAGTIVLVRPGLHRAAIATEADTLVLAVGGPPTFEPAGSEWLELAGRISSPILPGRRSCSTAETRRSRAARRFASAARWSRRS